MICSIGAGIGRNVRRLRLARGLRQNALAAKLGMHTSTLSGIENGRNGGMETPTLFRLAVALRCRLAGLLIGVDEVYDAQRVRQQGACEYMAEAEWPTAPSEIANATADAVPS